MRGDGNQPVTMPPIRLQPVRWEMRYPVEAEPLGEIVLDDGLYAGSFRAELLGNFRTGDDAAAAIWERFLDLTRIRHHIASRIHGSADRHPH